MVERADCVRTLHHKHVPSPKGTRESKLRLLNRPGNLAVPWTGRPTMTRFCYLNLRFLDRYKSLRYIWNFVVMTPVYYNGLAVNCNTMRCEL